MTGIQQSLLLIVQSAFGLYSVAVLLRLLMRVVNADDTQPLVHGIMKITDWPVHALKRWLSDWRQWEVASLVLLMALYVIKAYVVCMIQSAFPAIIGVMVWSLGSLLQLYVQTLFYLLIIRALLSWLPAFQVASFQPLVEQLTEPVMAPARRHIPLIGGFDLSPIALLLAIQILRFLIINPLLSVGMRLALSHN